jgi:hypothetical protein
MRIAGLLNSITLQRTKVVSISKLGTQFFKDRPVPLLTLMPHFVFKMALEISNDTVVVKQCVIDIEKKHNLVHSHEPSSPAVCPGPSFSLGE